MVIPLSRGYNYGRYDSHPHCIAGHLRPLDYHFGADSREHYVRLGHVGVELGAGGGSGNFHCFRVPSSKVKGEQKWQ